MHYAKKFPEFLNQKKTLKFARRIGRFLRNYEILQILSQHLILAKKAKACSQKILPFTLGVNSEVFLVKVSLGFRFKPYKPCKSLGLVVRFLLDLRSKIFGGVAEGNRIFTGEVIEGGFGRVDPGWKGSGGF